MSFKSMLARASGLDCNDSDEGSQAKITHRHSRESSISAPPKRGLAFPGEPKNGPQQAPGQMNSPRQGTSSASTGQTLRSGNELTHLPAKASSKIPPKSSSSSEHRPKISRPPIISQSKTATGAKMHQNVLRHGQSPDPRTKPSVETSGTDAGTRRQKLSYKEMMRQAAKINPEKLKLTLKTRTQSPRSRPSRINTRSEPDAALPPPTKGRAVPERNPERERINFRVEKSGIPLARPSTKLSDQLQRRQAAAKSSRRNDDYEDDNLSDFIADSDEGEGDADDNSYREQIRNMFRRRSSPAQYDSDSSDMEASAGELHDEERLSSARARREDIEEERRIQELVAAKAKRKRLH